MWVSKGQVLRVIPRLPAWLRKKCVTSTNGELGKPWLRKDAKSQLGVLCCRRKCVDIPITPRNRSDN